MGYYPCFTPQVIQRNIVENPGWYTAYTPYQPEIAQGRLEALLNYQPAVPDLPGLPIANASLLDEATAAAEAVHLTQSVTTVPAGATPVYLVADNCHPQTIAVLQTRAVARGLKLVVADPARFSFAPGVVGALVQYPTTEGAIEDYARVCAAAHAVGALVTAATDLLALTLLQPPGEWGADIAVGSSQRFGVPMGYGGPHAAFFATREEYKRHLPGRIIGVSRDGAGRPALRVALQTREQHIRREKATSNMCTAQVLLAVMASMYAVYHGPEGLRRIAQRVHTLTVLLATALSRLGYRIVHQSYFDTLCVEVESWALARLIDAARARRTNLRPVSPTRIGIALDETTTLGDLADLVAVFSLNEVLPFMVEDLGARADTAIPEELRRTSPYLTHPVFQKYRSETEMLRYIKKLEARDLSLTSAMIPLGSCTMKLNATTEMAPLSWREFNRLHPFAPREQAQGYRTLFRQLEQQLAEITGFPAGPRQPHSGAQGAGRGAPRPPRRHHDHLSIHARGVRDVDSRYLPHRARAGRPGVHGRGEHDRAGGPVPPRRLRGRPLPPQPPQDLLHPPRRRRPGDGPRVRGRAPRPVPPRPPGRPPRAHQPLRHRVGGAVGQRVDPPDLVGLRRPHGPRGAGRGDEARDPERQLHRQAPLTPLRRAVHRAQRARRARVHHRHAPLQAVGGNRGGRHRQADHRLRLPSPDGLFPRAGHADDRADGERIEGGAGPLLRRTDLDPRGNRGDRGGPPSARQQPAHQRPPHARGRHRRPLGPPLPAGAGGVPRSRDPPAQGVALGRARGWGVRGPQSRVRVPAGGSVCPRGRLKRKVGTSERWRVSIPLQPSDCPSTVSAAPAPRTWRWTNGCWSRPTRPARRFCGCTAGTHLASRSAATSPPPAATTGPRSSGWGSTSCAGRRAGAPCGTKGR